MPNKKKIELPIKIEKTEESILLSKILAEIEDLRGELKETQNELASVKESLRYMNEGHY